MQIKTGHSNPTARTSTLWFRYLLDAIARTGLDVEALASDVGLDMHRLDDPEAFIEDEFTARLLTEAANRADDPAFGLTAGQYFVPSAFGPLGYTMMSCATLQGAMERTVQFTATVTESTSTRLIRNDSGGFLVVSMPSYLPDVARLLDEFLLMTILTAFRWLIGHHFTPLRVELMCTEPRSTLKYAAAFGLKPVFSSARCGFQFSREQLDSKIIFADAAMTGFHDQYAASKLGQHYSSYLVPHVRRVIQQQISIGEPTLTEIAELMNMSARTLQRRLKHEQLTFHQLVDEIRQSLLDGYLLNSDLPLKEIAALLGFADQSSFTRAVNRWHGQAPKSRRLALIHQA